MLLGGALSGGFGGGGGGLSSLLGSLFNEGGYVDYKQAGGMMGQDPMMQPEAPMSEPMGGIMAPPADPMMPSEPADVTQITAVASEDVSEMDKLEGILKGLALDNPNITVKRKTKGGK